jgi:elongation factor Ts
MDQKTIIELVKKIRVETGLSIGEIKTAVEEAGGDEAKAKQILKDLGLKKVEKRAEKEVHQGRVATYTHTTGKIGVMVELLCETDFVAKNEEFVSVTRDLCLQIAAMSPASTEELLEMDFIKDPSKKIKDLVTALVAKFGENIKVGRMARFEI